MGPRNEEKAYNQEMKMQCQTWHKINKEIWGGGRYTSPYLTKWYMNNLNMGEMTYDLYQKVTNL